MGSEEGSAQMQGRRVQKRRQEMRVPSRRRRKFTVTSHHMEKILIFQHQYTYNIIHMYETCYIRPNECGMCGSICCSCSQR
jgi:hypothetical protein